LPKISNREKFEIDMPAIYRIRVQGTVDPDWSNLICSLSIEKKSIPGKETMTTLVGVMVDQASLIGILNVLYDLRIPLLSVEILDENVKKPFQVIPDNT
jgi:hypothetical protein